MIVVIWIKWHTCLSCCYHKQDKHRLHYKIPATRCMNHRLNCQKSLVLESFPKSLQQSTEFPMQMISVRCGHIWNAFVSKMSVDNHSKRHLQSAFLYLKVADSAGIVLRNVKNITKKHKLTKYHKLWQLVLHIVLIASYPRSSVLFGADMHSQSK